MRNTLAQSKFVIKIFLSLFMMKFIFMVKNSKKAIRGGVKGCKNSFDLKFQVNR